MFTCVCVSVCLSVHGYTLAWQCAVSRVCGMCVCCVCVRACVRACVDDGMEATRSLGSTAVLGDSGIGKIFHGRSIGNFLSTCCKVITWWLNVWVWYLSLGVPVDPHSAPMSSSGLLAYKPALTLFLLEKCCFSFFWLVLLKYSSHLCLSCPILSIIKDHWHNWHHTRSLLGFGLHYLIAVSTRGS